MDSRGRLSYANRRSARAQPARDSIALHRFRAKLDIAAARSCFMCSAFVVPVSGRIPTLRAKLNTTWAGVALALAARLALLDWRSEDDVATPDSR